MSYIQCCKTLYSKWYIFIFLSTSLLIWNQTGFQKESLHGFLQLGDDFLEWRTLQHLAEGPCLCLMGTQEGGLLSSKDAIESSAFLTH